MHSIELLIPRVCAVARQAGAQIMAVYERPIEVVTKADASPLTIADLRSHDVIARGLAEIAADVPLLSEESSDLEFARRRDWSSLWLVDPLDGTKEFLARNGEFTVNIAFIAGHAPVFGVVYAPAKDVLYWGGRNLGAYRQEGTGPAVAIRIREPAPAPLRVVGSRSHAGDTLAGLLPTLGAHELVQIGSSLKFCLIAEGTADVYPRLGPTSEWDTAAAQAVLEGAGGRVLDPRGEPLRYNGRPTLLNPHFVAFGDASRDWVALLFPRT